MSDHRFDPTVLAGELAQFAQRTAALGPALQAASNAATGGTPRELVWCDGKVSLHRYRAVARPARVAPLLIVYALVNRPYIMDLEPERSLIRSLLARGLDVYLIDWGSPDGGDRFIGLDDYLNRFLHRAVQHILDTQKIAALNLLGVCQGGTFSLCYTAMHPERVRNLIAMVTPVDFKTPENLLSKWAQGVDMQLMTRNGNVSGEFLNAVYLALMPFRLTQQKYIALACAPQTPAQLETFMRMERWIFDSPDLAATAFREFTEWFFQQNRLITGGLSIGAHVVDLAAITQPLLNIYATKDHLVPPSASIPLESLVSSKDYEALPVETGHIGMYVSGSSRQLVPAKIVDWLLARR
ncbi:MAG: class III poly(R)-hydroxyalkanoic acid synthase subunit PhaC [Steroidobacteraceae bacterium]